MKNQFKAKIESHGPRTAGRRERSHMVVNLGRVGSANALGTSPPAPSPRSGEGNRKSRRSQSGVAMVTSLISITLIGLAAASFIDAATSTVRIAKRQSQETQATHLCEAGMQTEMYGLWKDFKVNQDFVDMDAACSGATAASPKSTVTGVVGNIGDYATGVISYQIIDNWTRVVRFRSVGWIDHNNNGVLDKGEARKTIDITTKFVLLRSGVFDYTYFVNNYGWMDGFGQNDLYINGDMRANGDFNFTNGSPTVNGSVIGCQNNKLTPASAGDVNTPPVKMDDNTYAGMANGNSRMRQSYNQNVDGQPGTSQFENWRDLVFQSDAQMVNGRVAGAAVEDVNGIRAWDRTSAANTGTSTFLDQNSTQELAMPDLSDLNKYIALSNTYTDEKRNYGDGSTNPFYGQGASVQVWDPSVNSGKGGYQTLSTNGVVNGSAALVGTKAHPILIHGPVTFTQDAVIKGVVSGQGTIYTGRNIHVVGSITYANPPDFRGSNMQAIDNTNEKKDMLGLAARASVIMGDTSKFTADYPLQYMTPPFTKARYDDNGNLIPAYDATQVDSTGFKKYQSVLGDSVIHKLAEGVNQIDAIMYTNFVGGGNIGTGHGGVKINGSIISKDEAMVVFSVPMYMNYDNRIRDRGPKRQPLIDIDLPRSPALIRDSWQDRGFGTGL